LSITRVGIIGAGQMGAGIAQVVASSGLDVVLQDVSADALKRGKMQIEASLDRLVSKGKLDSALAEAAKNRIKGTQHMEDLSRCGLVIEAASENWNIKKEIFVAVDKTCAPGTIIATNTSSISITQLAALTGRPGNVIGMHFMNPVPVMKLVEVISGLRTSDHTLQAVRGLAQSLGKVVVESKDFPGFIVNRVLMPMINEAVFALYEGIASAVDIDSAMKLGTNQPMGPLELADFIGLDTCLAILDVLHEGLGDPKYRACPLLKQYVAAGLLGRKTKRGFYSYDT
jgi:3-hydroxybutyryl-CoA dehydrogenase